MLSRTSCTRVIVRSLFPVVLILAPVEERVAFLGSPVAHACGSVVVPHAPGSIARSASWAPRAMQRVRLYSGIFFLLRRFRSVRSSPFSAFNRSEFGFPFFHRKDGSFTSTPPSE